MAWGAVVGASQMSMMKLNLESDLKTGIPKTNLGLNWI